MNAHSVSTQGGMEQEACRVGGRAAGVLRRAGIHLSRFPLTALQEVQMKSNSDSAELVLQTEIEAVIHDRGLLTSPRPSVDRERLQHHLREVLRLLHVNLDDENLLDTP